MKVDKLAFVDTETGGLDPDRCALLEVALVVTYPNGDEIERVWWLAPHGDIDATALKVNKWGTRKPEPWYEHVAYHDIEKWAEEFADLVKGAAWVGCIPWFDTAFIEHYLSEYAEIKPTWHHRLIDLEAMAFGYLQAKGMTLPIPYGSDHLSRLCGVTPPEKGERHTAIGDARWNRRWFEAMTK